MSVDLSSGRDPIRLAALLAGPAMAVVLTLLLPDSYVDVGGGLATLSPGARMTLGVMAWMGIWWLTEAIDIAATAILPVVLFPILGVLSMRDAAASYAHPLIFLFLGGLLMATSMQKWGLDRRIALGSLALVGTGPIAMIGGFMAVTAFLSMWVSNTATTAMMLPIAISVIALVTGSSEQDADAGDADAATPRRGDRFSLCLLLGIAYSASIGGLATIIGSPPNGFTVGYLEQEYGREITFLEWMWIGLPLVAIMLPICWLMLTRVTCRPDIERIPGGRATLRAELHRLGPPRRGEVVTALVFGTTALLWTCRPLLASSGWSPLAGLTDGGIAMLGALVLFVIPASLRPLRPVLDWSTAQRIPWGILILFGGGLCLARAVDVTRVPEFLASQASLLGEVPPFVIVIVITTGIIFLTELTSNTATVAALVPVLAALATGLEFDPLLLILPATFAASCAFMMPVATPPNALVFASGRVTIPQMAFNGVLLNLIAVLVVAVLGALLGPAVVGEIAPQSPTPTASAAATTQ